MPGSAVELGTLGPGTIVPVTGDQEFSTSGRRAAVSAGKHTITFEIGDGESLFAKGTMTALKLSEAQGRIDAIFTG